MTREELKKEQEKFDKYKEALKGVYADGSVSSAERNRLITLKNELGLSELDCSNMEKSYKLIADNAREGKETTFEDLCKCHHSHCFDKDGYLQLNTIDYTMKSWEEFGNTYVEISEGGVPGFRENYAVAIGDSFNDLIDEYGENHIEKAIKDGKLQVFDEQSDMFDFIKMKFDVLSEEEVLDRYSELLNEVNLGEYQKLTGKDLYEYCHDENHRNQIIHDFGKTSDDEISEEFATAILNILDGAEYDVGFRTVDNMNHSESFILYDRQKNETEYCDISRLITLADRIANEAEIDFEHPENTPSELNYYRMFSDFLEYSYPSAAKYQAKWIYDQDVTDDQQINFCLEEMGLLPANVVPENYNYDKLHEAVWNLSNGWTSKRESLEKSDRNIDKYAKEFIKNEMWRLEWNRNKKGTNSVFREVGELVEVNPNDIRQIVAVEENFGLNNGLADVSDEQAKAMLDMINYDETSFYFMFDAKNGNFVQVSDKEGITDVETPGQLLGYLEDEVEYRLKERNSFSNDYIHSAEVMKELIFNYKENRIYVDYVFTDYFDKTEMSKKGVSELEPIIIYEKPRWTFRNNHKLLDIIKNEAPVLHKEIIEYAEAHRLMPAHLYMDLGKSLRYDDEIKGDFSKESIEDKLDDRFIVRYSCEDDDGNLGNGGDEIVIKNKAVVETLNLMIYEHVDENIRKYSEYKALRSLNNDRQIWTWHDYDDLSGHLKSPDGKEYFVYDWTTKEYKTTRESSWDSFIDADPTRDTSLSALKIYAENYIRKNIAKDNNIVFEQNYIDTTKEIENEIMNNETLADKYNRMEKFFDGKTSNLGNADYQNFRELYDWVQEEFPEKDSEHVLLETVLRMVNTNVHFGHLEPANYDDVFGNGDGAEQRFDVSDEIAKRLLDGEIKEDWIVIQDEVDDFVSRRMHDLKQNDPDMQVTDRINVAFKISIYLYPGFAKLYEHDVPENSFYNYTKSDKKAYIENAWEALKNGFEKGNVRQHEKRRDELIIEDEEKDNRLLLEDLESLIKGRDAVLYGKESLSYIRPNAEQLQSGIEGGWDFSQIVTGYSEASSGIKNAINIEKIDEMDVFDSDESAAQQYAKDHNVRILEEKRDIWIGDEDKEYFSYPDTPENRAIMKENGWLLEHPLEFDFSEFTEENFNKIRDELLKENPNEDYYGRLHIGSIHVEFVINQNDGWVDTNYYILGEKGEGETQFGVPYNHFSGHQFAANLFTDNSYEQFKEKVSRAVIEDIAAEPSLKPEAMRPLVDWNNEQQCKELYRTKLVESARLNEIVIAPYSKDERDIEVIREFIANIENSPTASITDDKVRAVIDNIGAEQTAHQGDFLKIHKDGTVEHISANSVITKEPVEILNIINSFAEDHASVSEKDSQQRMDYEITSALYEKAFNDYVFPTVTEYKDMLEVIQYQIKDKSGITVDEKLADEIYSRYQDNNLRLEYQKDVGFHTVDLDGKTFSEVFDIETAVNKVIAWDDKELSELHPGTADDETITKIKGYLEELEHVSEQLIYCRSLNFLDSADSKDVETVQKIIAADGFKVSSGEAKTLLRFASNVNDGTFQYAVNNNNQLYFRTKNDNYGWQFIPPDDYDYGFEIVVNAFDHAITLLEDDQTEYIQAFKSFVEKNKKILSNEDWKYVQEGAIGEFENKLNSLDTNREKIYYFKDTDSGNILRIDDIEGTISYSYTLYDVDFGINNTIHENDTINIGEVTRDFEGNWRKKEPSIQKALEKICDEEHLDIDNYSQISREEATKLLNGLTVTHTGDTRRADGEILKSGHLFRMMSEKEKNEYIMNNYDDDAFEEMLDQFSNTNEGKIGILSDALAESFATLDRHDDFWQAMLDKGADPTKAIRITAADANLYDNCHWLLSHVDKDKLHGIFSNKEYADAVFGIAKQSVTNDQGSWTDIDDIGIDGFKEIAELCGRGEEATKYYNELVRDLIVDLNTIEMDEPIKIEPPVEDFLSTPKTLCDFMNANRISQNEPVINETQAMNMLQYLNYENYKIYADKDGKTHILDVSEDFDGIGEPASNFDIITHAVDLVHKAEDYGYSCYGLETANNIIHLREDYSNFLNPERNENISFVEAAVSNKEPIEIIKDVASAKEAAAVPELFEKEFRKKMIKSHGVSDPFIVSKSIISELKTSKPEAIPVLNAWFSKKGCTSKKGFEEYFDSILNPEQKRIHNKKISNLHER